MFIDNATILVKAGNGGDGMVSFRTEKYVPNGGPDGGNGGRGGDVLLVSDKNMRTLRDFRYKRKYFASDGANGGRGKRDGVSGDKLVIRLPVGTIVRDEETNRVLVDLKDEGQEFTVVQGGHGGRGNTYFANSVRQAPKFARAGAPGEEMNLKIELKLLADVGLIGFPNVGKSTLLSVISRAKPKIADYHFTTLSPNLGVVEHKATSFVVADIPGLIEGASKGLGLGHDFLRHIERTKMFIHVVDVSGSEERNPVEDYQKINNELESYLPGLSSRAHIIAANKTDLAPDDAIDKLKAEAKKTGVEVFPTCAPINDGVDELLDKVITMLETLPEPVLFHPEEEEKKYTLEKEELFSVKIEDEIFKVEGKWVENLVDSTNFDDTESIQYFQRLIRKKGIIDALEKAGVKDYDTVVMHTLEFEFIY